MSEGIPTQVALRFVAPESKLGITRVGDTRLHATGSASSIGVMSSTAPSSSGAQGAQARTRVHSEPSPAGTDGEG